MTMSKSLGKDDVWYQERYGKIVSNVVLDGKVESTKTAAFKQLVKARIITAEPRVNWRSFQTYLVDWVLHSVKISAWNLKTSLRHIKKQKQQMVYGATNKVMSARLAELADMTESFKALKRNLSSTSELEMAIIQGAFQALFRRFRVCEPERDAAIYDTMSVFRQMLELGIIFYEPLRPLLLCHIRVDARFPFLNALREFWKNNRYVYTFFPTNLFSPHEFRKGEKTGLRILKEAMRSADKQ